MARLTIQVVSGSATDLEFAFRTDDCVDVDVSTSDAHFGQLLAHVERTRGADEHWDVGHCRGCRCSWVAQGVCSGSSTAGFASKRVKIVFGTLSVLSGAEWESCRHGDEFAVIGFRGEVATWQGFDHKVP